MSGLCRHEKLCYISPVTDIESLPETKPLAERLRELLMGIAREHEYLPPGPPAFPEDVKARAALAARAAIAALDRRRDDKTLVSDDLHKAVAFAFLTAIDDAYARKQGAPPSSLPEDALSAPATLSCVPGHMARLYQALDMPAKIHNAGFKWMLANKETIAAAGVCGNDCVAFILRCAYLIGAGRAARLLGG